MNVRTFLSNFAKADSLKGKFNCWWHSRVLIWPVRVAASPTGSNTGAFTIHAIRELRKRARYGKDEMLINHYVA